MQQPPRNNRTKALAKCRPCTPVEDTSTKWKPSWQEYYDLTAGDKGLIEDHVANDPQNFPGACHLNPRQCLGP